MRKVKRPAETGEYILITDVFLDEERYNNGDIFKVTDCATDCDYGDVYVNDIDDPWLVLYEEYVVLEDYLERDDVIDAVRYCVNDVLTCKTVGKNLLEPTPYEPTPYEPIAIMNKNGITINSGDMRTIVTPDGITTYKDDKLIFELKNKTENEKEGMINMNQVLKLYLDKHLKEIADKYDNLVEKEYNELEIVKEYKELINEFEINLQLLFDREENQINNVFERVVTENVYKYDLDEVKLKHEIAIKYRDAKEEEYNELNKLVEEVEAQLSLSDDLEYQLDVLKRYDIINKKTNKVN